MLKLSLVPADMLVIGLTGGIGTGKTAVSKVLRELGAEVIDADSIGHETYRRGSAGWDEVVEAFGEGVLAPDGEVDRGKLGAIVFADEVALARLNAIVHPRVRSTVEDRIRELRERGAKAVVVEAPLLLETGWIAPFDEVWVTTAPDAHVAERLHSRSNLDARAVEARVRAQMPQADRVAHADVMIDNSGSPEELSDRVRALWRQRGRKRKR